MIDFEWKLKQIKEGIEKRVFERRRSSLLRPHANVWSDNQDDNDLNMIYGVLPDEQCRREFLSLCLGSYLLAPKSAPERVRDWIQSKCPISKVIGIHVGLDEIKNWRWGRAAFPVVDSGGSDTILYALVGCVEKVPNRLFPQWIGEVMDQKAVEAVQIAAALARASHPNFNFFFWPFINRNKPVHDKSLGLPIYLSFMSLAAGLSIPPYIATGAIDSQRNVTPVEGILSKRDISVEKNYKLFIFPEDGSPLESKRGFKAIPVKTLPEAEHAWGITPRADIKILQKQLMPLPFVDDLIRLTVKFSGRKWLIEEIDAWLSDPCGKQVYWITGPPGVGKSSITAWLCQNRKKHVVAHHFCDFRSELKRNPVKFVRSLGAQLVENLPQYAEQLSNLPLEQILLEDSDAKYLFEALILQPLNSIEKKPSDPSMVILVDALDEATEGINNSIAQVIASFCAKLPSGIRFIITSRTDDNLTSTFFGITPHFWNSMAIQNQNDIAAYLRENLPELTHSQRSKILSQSEGIFLYIRRCIDDINTGQLSLKDIDKVSLGLVGQYRQEFDRQFSCEPRRYQAEIRPLIRILCTAYEPLPLGLAMAILGLMNREELFDRLECLGSLFPRSGEGDNDCIAPFHLSIKDWVSSREMCGPYYVDIESGHRDLATYGWHQYEKHPEHLHDYFLAYLPLHLAACGRHEDAVALLKDFDFMMSRLKAGQLRHLLDDYRNTKDPSLEIESDFFRGISHLLQTGDEEWPSYKILLQLAIEHADDSPLSSGAEKYLADGKCDWAWLRRELRPESKAKTNVLATMNRRYDDVGSIADDSSLSKAFAAVNRLHDTRGLRLLPDGRVLSWHNNGGFSIWNQTGDLLVSSQENNSTRFIDVLPLENGNFITWSHLERNCNVTFGGGPDETVRLWDGDGNQLKIIATEVKEVRVLPNNTIIASNSNGELTIFDAEGNSVNKFCNTGFSGKYCANDTRFIVISDKGIILTCIDNYISVYDLKGYKLSTLEGHTNTVIGAEVLNNGCILSWAVNEIIIWTSDGMQLHSIDNDKVFVGNVRVLQKDRFISWSKIYDKRFRCKSFIYDKERLPDKKLRLWSFEGQLIGCLDGHKRVVNSIYQSSDGLIYSLSETELCVWSSDGTLINYLKIWESYYNGSYEDDLREYQDVDMKPFYIKLKAPLLKFISKKRLIVWNNVNIIIADSNGNLLNKIIVPHQGLYQLEELPDGRIIEPDILDVWDNQGQYIGNIGQGNMDNYPYLLLDNNKMVVSYPLRILNLDRSCMNNGDGQFDTIIDYRYSEDGQFITRSRNRTLNLWSPEGRLLKSFNASDTSSVETLIDREDGSFLSWSPEGEFFLWDSALDQYMEIKWHQTPEFSTTMCIYAGALLLQGNRFIVWRVCGDSTIIILYDCMGNFERMLQVPRIVPRGSYVYKPTDVLCTYEWVPTTNHEGIRLMEDCNVLIDCGKTVYVTNQHLEILHTLQVANENEAFASFNTFVGGGIFCENSVRYISTSASSLFIWEKQSSGNFELTTEIELKVTIPESYELKRLSYDCMQEYQWEYLISQIDKTNEKRCSVLDGEDGENEISYWLRRLRKANYLLEGLNTYLISGEGEIVGHWNDHIYGSYLGYAYELAREYNDRIGTIVKAEVAELTQMDEYHESDSYWRKSKDSTIRLFISEYSEVKIGSKQTLRWYNQISSKVGEQFNDRVVVFLQNGELCVLYPYSGKRRATIDGLA